MFKKNFNLPHGEGTAKEVMSAINAVNSNHTKNVTIFYFDCGARHNFNVPNEATLYNITNVYTPSFDVFYGTRLYLKLVKPKTI